MQTAGKEAVNLDSKAQIIGNQNSYAFWVRPNVCYVYALIFRLCFVVVCVVATYGTVGTHLIDDYVSCALVLFMHVQD